VLFCRIAGLTPGFNYNNNRHLVTSINYNVGDPTGNTAVTFPTVSFGYDAVGNPTSMSDGLGTSTYHYDALSRMDWEEKSLSVHTYRLSYSYNLANELTGITGPSQFGSVQVGYNYDDVGRLNSVTGSG
jgi:hypothetical protein